MTTTTTYYFPSFHMIHAGSEVVTVYEDGCKSVVQTNKDHQYHAGLLGLTADEASLQHEIAHHLVAMAYGNASCPIIWASAHNVFQPSEAYNRLEWLITAISYFSRQVPMREEHLWGAIRELSNQCDVWKMGKQLNDLLQGFETNGVTIIKS